MLQIVKSFYDNRDRYRLYFRACIFPFLIKGGKPTPFVPFVLAFVFCVVNGYLQCAYLLFHADYGPDWMTKPHFWIGNTIFVLFQ